MHSNSWSEVKIGTILLIASAVEMSVAGTVIDSVTTRLSRRRIRGFLLIYVHIKWLTGWAALACSHEEM